MHLVWAKPWINLLSRFPSFSPGFSQVASTSLHAHLVNLAPPNLKKELLALSSRREQVGIISVKDFCFQKDNSKWRLNSFPRWQKTFTLLPPPPPPSPWSGQKLSARFWLWQRSILIFISICNALPLLRHPFERIVSAFQDKVQLSMSSPAIDFKMVWNLPDCI